MYQPSGSSWKYIVSLTFALFMVLLILGAVNLVFLFQIEGKLDTTISRLNTTVSNGLAGSRLVMIWNNSDVGFASPEEIGHTNYLPARFSYDVTGFRKIYIYYWVASGSSLSIWDVSFSTAAFQKYVTSFTISSTDIRVLELDAQATYLNVSLSSYAGGIEGYLSLYLYLV